MTNEAALKGALSTVQTVVGGAGQLVAEGMARCQERVQQATLCVLEKESVLQLLVRTARPSHPKHTGSL